MTLTELQPDWASSGSKRHATTEPERQWKGGKARQAGSINRKWQKELSNLKDMFIIKVPLSLCRSTLGLLKVNTRREREIVEWESRLREVCARERENNKRWQKIWRSCFQFTSVWVSCVCLCVCAWQLCLHVFELRVCVCVCVCFNWIT